MTACAPSMSTNLAVASKGLVDAPTGGTSKSLTAQMHKDEAAAQRILRDTAKAERQAEKKEFVLKRRLQRKQKKRKRRKRWQQSK